MRRISISQQRSPPPVSSTTARREKAVTDVQFDYPKKRARPVTLTLSGPSITMPETRPCVLNGRKHAKNPRCSASAYQWIAPDQHHSVNQIITCVCVCLVSSSV